MKKLITLLWLFLAAFTIKATAQGGTSCNADFTFQYLSGATVKFTPVLNDSPAVIHSWNYGDGSAVNHNVSPTHTFALPGTYAVVHTVVRLNPNGLPICTQSTTKQIIIDPPCTLSVNFSSAASSNNSLLILFTNLSVPLALTDSITWNFGDNTISHDVNPVHTYANAGTYNVCLIVKKWPNTSATPCIKYICKPVVVNTPCNLVVDFSSIPSTANPLEIHFTNLSVPPATSDSTIWTFGDGTGSTVTNPVHLYANAGTYTVCLTVKKNNTAGTPPCVRYICKSVIVTAPCTLVADFSSAAVPPNLFTIQFTNLSIPLSPTDSITWTFGDGSTSNAVNPLHTYTSPGIYTVCLRVKKNNNTGSTPCVREICKSIIVSEPCTLVVNFSWTATATNPLMVHFTNLSVPSSPTDSTTWSFGDGSSSTTANPLHTYANAGTYNVCLIVKKNSNIPGTTPCVRYICKTVVVQAPCTLQANFTWHPDSANAQKIWFTNTSVPLSSTDSIRWTFGDGGSSNLINPDHTYAQPGNYTVCLRVQKRSPAGTVINCVSEICKTIIVYPTCNFQANYSWKLDSINVKKVYFTNLTIVPTTAASAIWFFGDGTSASTWNAVHEYANPGRYYVCLRVQLSPNCVRYKCDSITVPVPPPPCNNQSNFTYIHSSTNSQTYTFTPDYQSAAAVYTWTFGDGTGSHDMIATHHYAHGGTYTACLTVWRSASCASTTCKIIAVTTQINCDSIHVTYNYQRDPLIPNKIYFYAVSNTPILDQTWTITRLNGPNTTPPIILHQNNPVYLFGDTGLYRVCLRAVTLGGCVKEYCSNIHIEHTATQCTLQAYPNPASSQVSVNVTLSAAVMINVYVYNTMNVLVKEKHQPGVAGNNVVTLSIGDLPSGYYTMKVIYDNHICYSAFQKL